MQLAGKWARKGKRKYHSARKIPPSGKRPLHCSEWTSWTVKRRNEFDSDWLIFQEKSGGDSRGQQEKTTVNL